MQIMERQRKLGITVDINEIAQFRNFDEPGMELYNRYGSSIKAIQLLEAYLTQQERGGKLTENEILASKEITSLQGDNPVVGNKYYGIGLMVAGEKVNICHNFLGTLINIVNVDGFDEFYVQYADGTKGKYPDIYIGKIVVNTLLFASKQDYKEFLTFATLKYDVSIPKLEESSKTNNKFKRKFNENI